MQRLVSAWQPWLTQQGIPHERLAKWVKRAEEGEAPYQLDHFDSHRWAEIENGRFRMYMHWRLTWGIRKVDTEIRQEFEPKIIMDTANGISHLKDCFWYTVYSTKEEAAKVADIRKEAAKSLPTPLVTILQEKRSRDD